jgi:hypothetical protein
MRRFREVRNVEKTDLSRLNKLLTGQIENASYGMPIASTNSTDDLPDEIGYPSEVNGLPNEVSYRSEVDDLPDEIDALPEFDDPGDEIDNLPDFAE